MVEVRTEGIVGSFGSDSFVGDLDKPYDCYTGRQIVSVFVFCVPYADCVGYPYPPASFSRIFC